MGEEGPGHEGGIHGGPDGEGAAVLTMTQCFTGV